MSVQLPTGWHLLFVDVRVQLRLMFSRMSKDFCFYPGLVRNTLQLPAFVPSLHGTCAAQEHPAFSSPRFIRVVDRKSYQLSTAT